MKFHKGEKMKNKILKITKDYNGFIKNMTDKQASEFVKAVCARVFESKPLVTKDNYLKGVFAFVERDLTIAAQNSINGKKGANVLAEKRRDAVSANIEVVVIAEPSGAAKVE